MENQRKKFPNINVFFSKRNQPIFSSLSTRSTCHSELNFLPICILFLFLIFFRKHYVYRHLALFSIQTFSLHASVNGLERASIGFWFNSALGSLFSSGTSITTLINLHENCSCRQIPVQLHVSPHIILASLFLKRFFPQVFKHDSS